MLPSESPVRRRPRLPKTGGSSGRAKVTWAKQSMARSLKSTGSFLRYNLWAWPVPGVLALSLGG